MIAELVSSALGLALYLNTLSADFCYDDSLPQNFSEIWFSKERALLGMREQLKEKDDFYARLA